MAEEVYQVWQEGEWQEYKGRIPLEEEGLIRAKVRMTGKTRMEDTWDNGREVQFTRKQRRRLHQDMEVLYQKSAGVTLSEVYSPPRVTKVCREKGLKTGQAYDLLSGWDLTDKAQRKKFWQSLREEDPMVLLICPPCKAFSILQSLNFRRMGFDSAFQLVQIGLEHLQLAMELIKWQVKRGKYVIFEHPHGARSWQEPEMQEIQQMPGMIRTRCDMCQYGMKVEGEAFNQKPTGILTNGPEIVQQLSSKCTGQHTHQQLMGGIAHKAEVYPPGFCQAVMKGIMNQMQKDGGWFLRKSNSQETHEVYVEEDEEDEDEIPDQDPQEVEAIGEEEGDKESSSTISSEERRALDKLHRGLGHPPLNELIRFMKSARIKGEVVRWAAQNYRCQVCESRPKPKAVRVGSIPRTYQPNKVLGIDLIYIPQVGGKKLQPALSMLDWGTNYQMVELLPDKEPDTVWEAMWSSWIRTFGTPEVIVCDPGREFLSGFNKKATGHGMVVFQTGARAPWQNGKTERHGDHYKELLEKARSEVVLTCEKELRLLMQEVEQVKNRYSNRSGFSPVQRQIGQWPRSPAELMSDEAIDPMLVSGALVDDIERLHEMRRIAQKSFIEHNARRTVQQVQRARSKVTVEYKAGDYVYVYRVHRQRKRKDGGEQSFDQPRNKPRWVGPATVVTVDGANLWVTVWGELWKVAREQCRPATNLEKEGIELVLSECKEIIEEYRKSSKRTGYKDLTEQPWPDEEEHEEAAPQEEDSRAHVRFDLGQEDDEPYEPSIASNSPAERDIRRISVQTIEEPERENTGGGASIEEPGQESISSSSQAPSLRDDSIVVASHQPTAEQMTDPAFEENVRRSVEMSNRLDGLPSTSPIRGWRMRREGSNPYHWEMFLAAEEDAEEEELEQARARWQTLASQAQVKKKGSGDYWQVDLRKGQLTRHHLKKRKTLFQPEEECPVDLDQLSCRRKTEVKYQDNLPDEEIEDEWAREPRKRENKKKSWWKGKTTFFLSQQVPEAELQALETLMAERKRSDEVDMKKESAEDLKEWKQFDKAEWNKIIESGAVKLLSVEESRKVKQQLAQEGRSSRILPTKIARRYKPSEQPGVPASKKSRLCLRGDLDPDIMGLEKFSPTVTTMNLAVMMQIAANAGMSGAIGDFKNAFCQSQPLERKEGPLYFRQPPEGIEGVDPECIAVIIAGCYGLVDAPLHWRKSLTDFLKTLNYQQSKLDPCIYKIYKGNQIEGMIAIEVDDLFMVGGEMHSEQMAKLRDRFTFGKWVDLKSTPEGAMFNGRRLRQTAEGEFQIDMQKFIEERLQEVRLEKGRATQKKSEANDTEKSLMRAACGSLNWLSKEGRPDLSGPASLLSSKLATAKVEDVMALNDVIRSVKKVPELCIRIQPLVNMKFGVVSDASFGNDGMHSQSGQIILSYEDGLQQNKRVRTNVLCWRSGKIQRVVNSTLAAETQSLSRGLGDLLWTMVLFEELRCQDFELRMWPQKLSASKVVAMASRSTSEELKGSLAIVDAKSLYDQLCKETVPLVAGLGFRVRRIALFPFLSYSSSSPLDLDLVQVLSWHSSTFVSTLPLLLSILDLLSHFFNLHRMAAYLHESGWPPHLHRPLAADSLESALDHIQDGEIEEVRSSGGGRAGGSGSASSRHSDTVWTEAGLWARATLDGRVAKPRPTPKIALRPVVYIIVRGPGIDQPIRCSSAADYYQALPKFTPDSISHSFPSLAEVSVYCEALGIPLPEERCHPRLPSRQTRGSCFNVLTPPLGLAKVSDFQLY
ncbi:unnamed protein product [Cladocopium goreaui]|uniref:Retrovirus-related Pol polyprotein from transposon RE1 (Retro element 1) (AtRE1) n=1 Tax=Cladocopium goreaui TaxID=2562237 RepID=A0A9P1FM50_9DINO|nr:unnamed protein product [Cladocopium goreaui]